MIQKLMAVAALVTGLVTTSFADPSSSGHLEPIISYPASSMDGYIDDSYLVVFKKHVRAKERALWVQELLQKKDSFFINRHEEKAGVQHVYDMGSFQGISGTFSRRVLDEIHAHPDTAYVERDGPVYMDGEEFQNRTRQSMFELERRTQTNAPWGLARISHRRRLTVSTRNRYEYKVIKPLKKGNDGDGIGDEEARASFGEGKGVTVYLIDSGVSVTHKEFEGRARRGKNFIKDELDEDMLGHGTHCAGTIASRAYGVAKNAEVVSIKMINAQRKGMASDLIAGLDYVVQAHRQRLEEESQEEAGTKIYSQGNGGDRRLQPYRGAVVSISLGWRRSPHSRAIDAAANAAVKHGGLHIVVSAGNDDEDACLQSPASSEAVITVGASTIDDERASFSNYGSCVDVFAPGKDVDSTWIGSDTAHHFGTGTSMAAPHVAGLVAYYLSIIPERNSAFHDGGFTSREMKALLQRKATRGVLKEVDERTTPNLLVYNGVHEDDYYLW
ncbi:Suppressor of the cold-sensitive snRNP biogenesis mutant brr1-1 [Mortierella sp. GBA30]|nr:Suppressor of the cold-sensitive snRNP biogenesis mutant brr1-1 [Mortierella sp. GBA30]